MLSARTHPWAVWLVMLTVLLLGRGGCSASAQDWVGIDNITVNAVKRVEASLGTARATCSAVIINTGHMTHEGGQRQNGPFVLTDAHCIPPVVEGRSILVDGKHSEVLKWNTAIDLAILRVEGLTGRALPLATAAPVVGERVAVVGYAFGAPDPYYTFGWISRVDSTLLNITTTYAFDVNVISGQSGGAVLNALGELVSIVQGTMSAPVGSLALGPRPDHIRDFAGKYWARMEPSR